MKFLKVCLINILFILVITNNIVYASMADFSDEDAEKETQKMIQEHKENFDSNKSNNNYLKDLSVTEGTLSPNFDRQVIEYSLKVDNNKGEIYITANAEDSEAKVNGTGKVDINNISEHKIEVIASSGTTRTYFIKIVKENEENIVDKNEQKDELSDKELEENIIMSSNAIKEEKLDYDTQKNGEVKKYLIIVLILLILLALVLTIIKKNKKNTKH